MGSVVSLNNEGPEEPPMTPEEEEQAPEDCVCGNPSDPDAKHRTDGPCAMKELPPPEGPEYTRCVCGAVRAKHYNGEGSCYGEDCDCLRFRPQGDPPPPQPERRPPYAVAYSVQGHLYEIVLPGDASAFAVDGALIIKHGLGPVAGIVQVLPIINEEST